MPFIDYLVLTALDEEWTSMIKILEPNITRDMLYRTDDSITYRLWKQQPRDKKGNYLIAGATMSRGTGGQANAAVLSGNSIRLWKPSRVVLMGIAGSLEADSLMLGDIVISENVFGYEVGDAYTDKFEFRRTVNQTSALDLDRVRAFLDTEELYKAWQSECYEASKELGLYDKLNGRPPELHIENIASGEFVVKSVKFGQQLKDQIDWSIKAVEMEARGLFVAMRQSGHRNDSLMIRGISDYADENKSKLEKESKDMWRKFASQNAARFLKAMLYDKPFQPVSPDYKLDADLGNLTDFRKEGIPQIEHQNLGSQTVSVPKLLVRHDPNPPLKIEVSFTSATDIDAKGLCIIEAGGQPKFVREEFIEPGLISFEIPAFESGFNLALLLSFSSKVDSLEVNCIDVFKRTATISLLM
ncbi:hypothetical protein QTN47_19490 [Danxiaibacter flavus]|uniref:Nucleoside phosphorylase domain-containing protein n=1 Tax=Danxiaibacter flavus TaxID=3049108 RepID=A0ABV3ZIQ6_9BACT|nr:hypothetical protein QNM32_19500 [Chitinophagaceae bacterium DXS]